MILIIFVNVLMVRCCVIWVILVDEDGLRGCVVFDVLLVLYGGCVDGVVDFWLYVV